METPSPVISSILVPLYNGFYFKHIATEDIVLVEKIIES